MSLIPDPRLAPMHILEKMSPEDRKSLGREARTVEEVQSDNSVKLERELHKLISNELLRRGIFFIHSRTDKKTTTAVGVPDFCFVLKGTNGPVPVGMEVKLPGKDADPEQSKVMDQMESDGWLTFVVTTFEQAKAVIATWGEK